MIVTIIFFTLKMPLNSQKSQQCQNCTEELCDCHKIIPTVNKTYFTYNNVILCFLPESTIGHISEHGNQHNITNNLWWKWWK